MARHRARKNEVLSHETVKYGHKSHGTLNQKLFWRGPAAICLTWSWGSEKCYWILVRKSWLTHTELKTFGTIRYRLKNNIKMAHWKTECEGFWLGTTVAFCGCHDKHSVSINARNFFITEVTDTISSQSYMMVVNDYDHSSFKLHSTQLYDD
jgi:hypothetical protein